MASATLKIAGMHCGSCVSHIEGALRRMPGVQDASVNLATSSGVVEYDQAAVGPAQLASAVKRAGYRVEAIDAPGAPGGAGAAAYRGRATSPPPTPQPHAQ